MLPFKLTFFLWIVLLLFVSVACTHQTSEPGGTNNEIPGTTPLFTLLKPEQTNIRFSNTITETPYANIFSYQYFYNGGGVAIADFNRDGLQDVYFSGNQVQNKLYLNHGKMKFEDVTAFAGVAGTPNSWKTGVTIA